MSKDISGYVHVCVGGGCVHANLDVLNNLQTKKSLAVSVFSTYLLKIYRFVPFWWRVKKVMAVGP